MMSPNKTDRKRGPRATTICPMCGIRQKAPNSSYCAICRRERQNEYRAKRRKAAVPVRCTRCGKGYAAPGKTYCRACLAEIARMRWRRKHPDRPVRDAVAKPQPQPPQAAEAPVVDLAKRWKDAPSAWAAMERECKARGYDPEIMLGLARVMPKIGVRRTKWRQWRLVLVHL